jgi:hypothetical protein
MMKRAFRKHGGGTPRADPSQAYRSDLAIPLGRGRHVTLFTSGVLLVCVAFMLVVAAVLAAMSVLWNWLRW